MSLDLSGKKIGLALGGGAVLGASHIGVLKALKEMNITIDYVSGTSIGALVASLFSCNKNFTEVKNLAIDLSWSDIVSINPSKFGLFANKKLDSFLTQEIADLSFDEATIPLAIVATNITTGEKVVMRKGNIAAAVTASCCIPGIFRPVEIDDELLVDGGIVENVPISPLKDMGADFIIAVDLNANHTYERPSNIVDVLMNSFHFTLATSSKIQTQEADLLITPQLSDFNRVDLDQTPDLIEKGYQAAKEKLKEIF